MLNIEIALGSFLVHLHLSCSANFHELASADPQLSQQIPSGCRAFAKARHPERTYTLIYANAGLIVSNKSSLQLAGFHASTTKANYYQYQLSVILPWRVELGAGEERRPESCEFGEPTIACGA